MFTLVACLFFIIVLLLVNIGLINKKTSQEKEIKEISKAYEINEQNMEDEYTKVAEENEYLTASQIREMIYPIGSIYISTNEVNPESFIGGTWERYAEGRTLVGVDSGDNDFAIAGNVGGEKTHALTVAEMPRHNHFFSAGGNQYGGFAPSASAGTKVNFFLGKSNVSATNPDNITIEPKGESQSHNNMQPYIVTYMWKRTK